VLTPSQQAAVDRIKENGGVVRRAGGFWSGTDVECDDRGMPAWHIRASTIQELLNRNLLIITAHRGGVPYRVVMNEEDKSWQ